MLFYLIFLFYIVITFLYYKTLTNKKRREEIISGSVLDSNFHMFRFIRNFD